MQQRSRSAWGGAAVLVLVLLLLGATVAGRTHRPGVARFHPAAVGQNAHRRAVARFHRVADAPGDVSFDPRAEAPREVLWIGQGTADSEIASFRRYHRGILAFLYKEALFADSRGQPHAAATSPQYPGGVSYFYANAHHAAWFLRDSAGNRLHNRRYVPYWALDIGNAAYQNTWATNAISEARHYGWNGIFADDLSCTLTNLNGVPAAYPAPQDWQVAVKSFLTNVAARLHAAGLKLISNSSACVQFPKALDQFAAAEDGVLEEGWMRASTEPTQALATIGSGVWQAQLNELIDAERNHKRYLAELPAYSSDIKAVRYGLATQLLGAQGNSSFDVSGAPTQYTRSFWSGDYANARRLRGPRGPYFRLAGGVYRRDFAGGSVLVNPTTSTVTVPLGGIYSGSGLTNRTTATMTPTSGLVLIARP